MHPDLISLGFLHVKTYGAFMALGFLAAWQVIAYLCRRTGRNPESLSNLLMLMMGSGVLGARESAFFVLVPGADATWDANLMTSDLALRASFAVPALCFAVVFVYALGCAAGRRRAKLEG